MITILLIILCILSLCTIACILAFRPVKDNSLSQLQLKILELQSSLSKIESALREDFRINRQENAQTAKENRAELNHTLKEFSAEQRIRFSELKAEQKELTTQTIAQLEKLTCSVEKRLEEMRITVDEKLQKTLNERLGQSFELVGRQLESVQRGLGEMQNLAQDVGGLKRVLSNVKIRGGIGEVQLAMLLEQILAPDQYQANVKTKAGSNDIVEFAIKLPGRDEGLQAVWLPVDAKFPKDVYEQLLSAHDSGENEKIEEAQKNLENTVKKMARDIHDKYIDPPGTTDFGIMFLPFEGIYAEVVRRASLLDELQRTYKIIVTGPTTLAAILNSLQMGFRTLAIQKRSGEVWKILGAVKKEFEQFGGMLQKAQNNIQTGLNQLDDVMGKRTRAIQRKLKGVESLGEAEASLLLSDDGLSQTGLISDLAATEEDTD